jgi:hypothetical protein
MSAWSGVIETYPSRTAALPVGGDEKAGAVVGVSHGAAWSAKRTIPARTTPRAAKNIVVLE